MRRQLRTLMPWLSAVYGLKWADVLVMPRYELDEYLEQLPTMRDWLSG